MRYLFYLIFLLSSSLVQADQELPMLGENARLNLQKEINLGQGLFNRLQLAGYVIEDPLLTRYLSDIGETLLSQLDIRLRDYHFFLVKDSSVNAFAAPGGFIGVNAGLIAMTKSEDELASVLAHEIAHVELMHTMQMIERAQEVNTAGMLSILAAILLSSHDPELATAMIYGGAAGSSQAMVNFTRANEYEADRVGIGLLKKSPYDATAMVHFMRVLQQKEQTGSISTIEYIRTHPIGSNRIAEIGARVGDKYKKKKYSTRYDQFNDYLFFLHPDLATQKIKSDFSQALDLIRNGKYSDATSLLRQLIKKDPDSIWYSYALAESLEYQQEYQKASDIYRSLLLLYPEDLAITIKQVNALIQLQRYQPALAMANQVVQLNESEARGHQMLVKLHELTGNKVMKKLAEANYHWFGGNKKQAQRLYQALLNEAVLDVVNEQKIKEKLAKK